MAKPHCRVTMSTSLVSFGSYSQQGKKAHWMYQTVQALNSLLISLEQQNMTLDRSKPRIVVPNFNTLCGRHTPNMHQIYWICMYVCMHVCVYACVHGCVPGCVYGCVHVCVYVCMCICVYVCVYVFIYVCIHT